MEQYIIDYCKNTGYGYVKIENEQSIELIYNLTQK